MTVKTKLNADRQSLPIIDVLRWKEFGGGQRWKENVPKGTNSVDCMHMRIDLYHAAAILSPRRTKSLSLVLPIQPRTGWEVRRAKSFVSALRDKVLLQVKTSIIKLSFFLQTSMPRCRLQERAVQKGIEHGSQHAPHFELGPSLW